MEQLGRSCRAGIAWLLGGWEQAVVGEKLPRTGKLCWQLWGAIMNLWVRSPRSIRGYNSNTPASLTCAPTIQGRGSRGAAERA
jgi:hypothetical protein